MATRTYVTASGYPRPGSYSDRDVVVCSATVERGEDEPTQSARRRAFEHLKTCDLYSIVDPFNIQYIDE